MLNSDDLLRYARQIKLEQIGSEGQKKLKKARVLCVGAGGLGSPLLLYLAAAGVGTLGIVDDDVIEESNLHRQLLYQQAHCHQKKVEVAKAQLLALNPLIIINASDKRLTFDNAESLLANYDLVADCSDNFDTRYLIQAHCYRLDKPYVYASAQQFRGHCSLFYGKQAPCLRCVFPTLPETAGNCQDDGVLGVLPGMLGMIQAAEIIKWVVGMGQSLQSRLLMVDVLTMRFQTIQLVKNPDCPLCIHGQFMEEDDLKHYALPLEELASYLKANPDALLLDVRSVEEHNLKNLGGNNIPLGELTTRIDELNPKMPILLYCQSGKRSRQALRILLDSGFMRLNYLQQG